MKGQVVVFVIGFPLLTWDVQQGVKFDDVTAVFEDVQAFSVVALPVHEATDPYAVPFFMGV